MDAEKSLRRSGLYYSYTYHCYLLIGIEYYITQQQQNASNLSVYTVFYFLSTNSPVCNRMQGPWIGIELSKKKALKVFEFCRTFDSGTL